MEISNTMATEGHSRNCMLAFVSRKVQLSAKHKSLHFKLLQCAKSLERMPSAQLEMAACKN